MTCEYQEELWKAFIEAFVSEKQGPNECIKRAIMIDGVSTGGKDMIKRQPAKGKRPIIAPRVSAQCVETYLRSP